MSTPIHLVHENNRVTAFVGRRRTPIDLADPGIQASFDRAITAYDGAVSGPLRTGGYTLDEDQLTPLIP